MSGTSLPPGLEHVVVVSDYGTINGGSAKVALMSARGLAEAGLRVTLVAGNGEPGSFLDGVPNLEFVGLNMPSNHDLPLRDRISTAIWNPAAAEAIGRVLATLDRAKTIVHVHSYRDVLTVAPVRRAMDLGFRVVFTVHDYRLGCPIGDFFNRQSERICTLRGASTACWTTQCSQTGWPEKVYQNVRYVRQRALGRVPEGLKCVIFVSRFSQSKLSHYLATDARQHVVGNPIDFPQPPRRTLRDDSPLVYIGRLQGVKDPVLAARAAREMGVPITFVGDGELREAVLQANPEAKITGWVGPEEVRRNLSEARGLLFPSRWYEGQPLATLEAVAYGAPVFCSATCAGSEVVEDYGAGVTFPAQNLEAVVASVTPLLEPSRNEEISRAAYDAFWSNPPTLARNTAETLSVYRQFPAYQ